MKMYLNATVYFNKLLQISAIFRYFTKKTGFFVYALVLIFVV